MAYASTAGNVTRDPVELARLHWVLRFGTGISLAMVICEAMGWHPSFIAPLLMAALHANLPASPPFKVGVVLVLVMAIAALIAFALPSLLRFSPQILVGVIGLIVFLALLVMALGKAKLPAMLLLLCIATVPIVALTSPDQASLLPIALVRATAIAVFVLWCMHALWPRVIARAAAPAAAPVGSPVRAALAGTAIVMPVMLIHLMFGLTDALPVLVTTVLLVTNLDPQRGFMHGMAMMLGNLIGGLIGLLCYAILQIAPSLVTLALITFVVACAFGARIEKGGPAAPVYLITLNASLLIFGMAILTGPSNAGIWITRLSQFAIACTFATTMMSLFWGGKRWVKQ